MRDVLKARRNLYVFLSEVYSRGVPRGFIEDVKKGVLDLPRIRNRDIQKGFEEIFIYIARPEGVGELLREIDDEYVRLFLGPGEAEVMPYQSTYEGNRVYGDTTLRIRNIYARAGLKMPAGTGIPEDHIAAEHLFMGQLCSSSIEMLDNEQDPSRLLDIQREFLEETMLQWIPRFCEDVRQSQGADFFRGIARVNKGFLEEDRSLLYRLIAQL